MDNQYLINIIKYKLKDSSFTEDEKKLLIDIFNLLIIELTSGIKKTIIPQYISDVNPFFDEGVE